MNFIRDIIGEKRRTGGQTGAGADPSNDDDRSVEERPEAGWEEPVEAFSDEDAAEDDETPQDDSLFLDQDEDDAGLPEAAPVTASRDRDVYEELRSIFVAEQKDRVTDADPEDDDLLSDIEPVDHTPLREAIQRVGTAAFDDEAMLAPRSHPDPEPAPEAPETPPLHLRREPLPWPRAEAALRATPSLRIRPETPKTQPAPGHAAAVGVAEPEDIRSVAMPGPAMGRGSSQAGRMKTRLLGFNMGRDEDIDPIASGKDAPVAAYSKFPLGWLIVISGPGRGAAFTLFNGVSRIGRGQDQTIPLDFGDNSISRENHAAIAYDQIQNRFYIGHGGKANLVRRNDRPVLATEELSAGDRITIGETILCFVPLCGEDFSWQETEEDIWSHATHG